MLCQICKKNPAALHIHEIKNGKSRVLHICFSCAKERFFSRNEPVEADFSTFLKTLECTAADIEELLKKGSPAETKKAETKKIVCPDCSWDIEQLKKTGLVGCANCYSVFEKELQNYFARHCRSTRHTGKIPFSFADRNAIENKTFDSLSKQMQEKSDKEEELRILVMDMDESVRREEYELAAKLRDKIQSLRKEIQNHAVPTVVSKDEVLP